MRTVTYGAACSLDGFIAGADGSLDWLHFSRDVEGVMAAYWATIDTVLMGRKTWGGALEAGEKQAKPRKQRKQEKERKEGNRGKQANPFGGMRTYVFSRTLTEIPHPGVELVREDAGAFVRELKRHPGKGICVMGGGQLAAALFEGDVIDEVGLNVHPVLLGTGIPLFLPMQRQIDLELTENQPLGNGCVLLRYRVKHRGGLNSPGHG